MSCDFLNGIHIPVPGQEYPAFRNRECIQEPIDCLHQLFLLYLFLYIVAAGNALLQFFQCKSDFSPAPFCTVQVSPAVDGDPAGDLPKESGQNGRAMGWHGIPCVHICIVDTFLSIFLGLQYTIGNAVAVCTILTVSFRDRVLRRIPL